MDRFDLDDLLYGSGDQDVANRSVQQGGGKLFTQDELERVLAERLGRMKRQVSQRDNEFRRLYGINPDEALSYAQGLEQQGAWDVNQALANLGAPAGGQPNRASVDPVQQDIRTLKEQQAKIIQRQALEAEGMEFSAEFGIRFEEIPQEVLEMRRNAPLTVDGKPSISLTQAMYLYQGRNTKQNVQTARQQGQKDALSGMQRRNALVSEGSTPIGASGKSEYDFIDADVRDIALEQFGMDPKTLLEYTQKAEAARRMR